MVWLSGIQYRANQARSVRSRGTEVAFQFSAAKFYNAATSPDRMVAFEVAQERRLVYMA